MQKIPKILLYVTAGLGLLVIVSLAFLAGQYLQPESDVPAAENNNASVSTNTAAETNVNSVNENTNTDTGRMALGEDGVTWLSDPEELDNLNLFKEGFDAKYYLVGTTEDGGKIIYSFYQELTNVTNRFRHNADGSYVLLANHSQEYIAANPSDYLAAAVTVDTETVYTDLQYPDTMTVNDMPLVVHWYPFAENTLFTLLDVGDSDLSEFADTDYGTMYLETDAVPTTYDNGSVEGKKYILVLADHSIVTYSVDVDFLADDNSIVGTWNAAYSDFAERSYMVGIVVGGCGVIGGDQHPADMTVEALEVVGATSNGDTLYTVLDGDNNLLLNAYESYKLGRDYEGSTIELLSYEEFVDATPLLLWQDPSGDFLVFMDTEYAPAVECGKPVVYLYPTTPTDVTVEVGADVRISEPVYNGGWNVTANPDGALQMADGSVYPNLFWEGKGHGVYPEITFGRVVSHNQVGAAIRSDLIKQGFNAKEIKDFLDFWMAKIPNTPYVRLSWLNTQQMNQLAPLQITPHPDTVIRTFLDFAGQQTPDTNLQPQQLTATPRVGFTVTEWGGLLLGQ